MIELGTLYNKDSSRDNNSNIMDLNNTNDQSKMEKKSSRSPSQRIPGEKKENKVELKNQKINNEININLSVGDINKMLTRQQKIKKSKKIYFWVYISLTLLFTNTTFIFMLAYLRPVLVIKQYYCYDLQSRNYYKCLTNTFCNCNHSYCVTFCYDNDDYSKCHDDFINQKKEIIEKNLNSLPTQKKLRKGIIETKIIYPMKDYENLSLFQKIGKYYCFMAHIDMCFLFVIGCGSFIGYWIFGIISDLYGKKKVIIILSILVFIFNGAISILSRYQIHDHNDYFVLLLTLWFIFIFFLSASLEPLESAIYVYFLEMYPSSDFIKAINCLLYVRYLVSVFFLIIFNFVFENLIYYFLVYEGYILIFIFVFGFVFTETPRFYSERQDNEKKAKALCFFTIEDVNFSFKENDDDTNEYMQLIRSQQSKYKLSNVNQNNEIKNIDFSYIRYKYSTDSRINKRYFMIQFSYFVLSYIFYTILLKSIFFFLDPNNGIKLKYLLLIFCLMILIFIVIQCLSYFVFEILALNICISGLLSMLFLFSFTFDIKDLYLNSYRDNLFVPELVKKTTWILAVGLLLIVYIIGIYEMMLLLLSPTLYRSYFFFRQKGVTYFSLSLSFLLVYLCECSIFIACILSFFSIFLVLIIRVKWKYDSFEEEINKKIKIL